MLYLPLKTLIFSPVFIASVIRIIGIPNIALEGAMLVGAFTGVLISVFTQNIYISFICIIIEGAFVGLFLSFCHFISINPFWIFQML